MSTRHLSLLTIAMLAATIGCHSSAESQLIGTWTCTIHPYYVSATATPNADELSWTWKVVFNADRTGKMTVELENIKSSTKTTIIDDSFKWKLDMENAVVTLFPEDASGPMPSSLNLVLKSGKLKFPQKVDNEQRILEFEKQ